MAYFRKKLTGKGGFLVDRDINELLEAIGKAKRKKISVQMASYTNIKLKLVKINEIFLRKSCKNLFLEVFD